MYTYGPFADIREIITKHFSQMTGYDPNQKYSVSAWMTGTYCMQTYSGWMQIDKYRY